MFEKNVVEMKKLVKDIGDLTPLIHKEQQSFFYMIIAILSVKHFFTKANKKIQCYGFISLQYNRDNEKVISS